MRFYLSCKTKLMLYYALIYPYITYCNSAGSSTYISNLNRIFYLQKRAVRAVTNSDYQAHTAPLFSQLKILDIFQINTLDIAKFMFRYHDNLLPPLFLNPFMTNSQVHRYDTRRAGNYRVHSCRMNIKKFTILYQGPRVWNCLPASINNLSSFSTFKNKVVEFLLGLMLCIQTLSQRQILFVSQCVSVSGCRVSVDHFDEMTRDRSPRVQVV